MRWRLVLLALAGILQLVAGIGRWHDGKSGFLVVAPLLTALFCLLALILWWRRPTAR